jgi:hypothetical protein
VNDTGKLYNFDQDSTDANGSQDKKKKAEAKYAKILNYFEDRVWREGDPPGTALMYKCKWCPNTY